MTRKTLDGVEGLKVAVDFMRESLGDLKTLVEKQGDQLTTGQNDINTKLTEFSERISKIEENLSKETEHRDKQATSFKERIGKLEKVMIFVYAIGAVVATIGSILMWGSDMWVNHVTTQEANKKPIPIHAIPTSNEHTKHSSSEGH